MTNLTVPRMVARKDLRRGKRGARIEDSQSGTAALAAMKERQPNTTTYSGRVAARIRALRKKRRMDRTGLHAALAQHGVKVSMPALYAYENGNRPVNPDHYPAFAKALGCKSVRAFLPAE